MNIEVLINPTATTASEAAVIELHVAGVEQPFVLDMDFTTILSGSSNVSELAKDFLLIAAVVYGCDKAVDRNDSSISEDRWTRDLSVSIPVLFPQRWKAVAETMEECVSFLTGDDWRFTFRTADRDIVQRRRRRRRRRRPFVQPFEAEAVSLFSGGLDSFIGAIDWLTQHPAGRIFLVGHYDRDVKGPKHDQVELTTVLDDHFAGRFQSVHGRIGVTPAGDDMNLRSRSFLFVALAAFFAEQLGSTVPIIIPENGPIALNLPLTPSRRGSCSTRTVHPHFLDLLAAAMEGVGFRHPLVNPYRLKTKGEMVDECQSQQILEEGYELSRSCAKGGHKSSWDNRQARACGRCIPCLFRRAALHSINHDDELYGIDVFAAGRAADALGSDFLSLVSFLRRNDTDHEIKKALIAHGPLPLDELGSYANLIARMRDEVRTWIAAKGSVSAKKIAGVR